MDGTPKNLSSSDSQFLNIKMLEVIPIPYCPNCGEEVSEETKFCPECGAELKKGGVKPRETSLGLAENIEGALAYLFGFISGIILYLIEEENRFVRFHALQSTIIFLGLFVVSLVLSFIPFLSILIGVVSLIAWLVGMIKAYQGKLYKFPIVGDIAEERI